MNARDRYARWLEAREAGATFEEDTSLAMGSFRFFLVKTPRGKRREAAASDQTLVAKDGTGDWSAFLRAGPAVDVAERIGWLQGTASLLTPEQRSIPLFEKDHPGLTAKLKAPRVDSTGATVHFEAWYVFEPDEQISLLVVDGRADGGTLTWNPFGP